MTTSAYSTLLARLEKVRQYQSPCDLAKSHRACCPAHADSSPSLSIALCNDGRILVHCFAGCSAVDILAAVGLGLADAAPDNSAFPARKGISRPSGWGSFVAALDATEDLVWQHLRGAPSVMTGEAALYALAELRRAGKSLMRAKGGAT